MKATTIDLSKVHLVFDNDSAAIAYASNVIESELQFEYFSLNGWNYEEGD